jgi:multidrug efflux pump subunit AcrB
MNRGFAGKLASAFVNSKLTPLLILASLVLGVFAVIRTPREEEPQIIVPMADVLVQFPGATVKEVEQRITSPLEKLIWEVPGVEYVYSTSGNGRAMVVVRFLVGQDQEKAFVRLREKIAGNADLIPQGASKPTQSMMSQFWHSHFIHKARLLWYSGKLQPAWSRT